MKYAVGLLMLAMPAMTVANSGHGASVEGAGTTATYDCEGGRATIEGASNTITFTGACSELVIEGAANIVRVDLAPGARIRVEGASNRVSWTMPGHSVPRQSIQGAGNRVMRAH